jgi:hypothetical protein
VHRTGSEWDEEASRHSSTRTFNRMLLFVFLLMLVVIVSLVLTNETIPRSGRIDTAPGPFEQVSAV